MSAKEMFEDLKINEWLELIKEDKNLKGAYICISQYIYLIQKENQKLKEVIDKAINELMNIPINASYSEIVEYPRKAYRALKEVK